jgi:hypothetical protein
MRKRIEGDLEDGNSVAQVADRRASIRTVQRYLNRIEQEGNADARAAGGGRPYKHSFRVAGTIYALKLAIPSISYKEAKPIIHSALGRAEAAGPQSEAYCGNQRSPTGVADSLILDKRAIGQ